MCHLERALECLRPTLMGSKIWDYCVVWTIKEEPFRSALEWVGCCCAGGDEESLQALGVKEEWGGTRYPYCRDSQILHVVKTKACQTVSKLPLSIILCSGIHGEVLASGEPSWLNITGPLDSRIADESLGTQVLIPVLGGLVELFARKHIPKDENVISYIMAQFHVSPAKETIAIQSCTKMSLTEDSHFSTPSSHHNEVVPREQMQQLYSPVVCSSDHFSYEGSCVLNKKKCKGHGKSRNLFTERKRRERIRKRLFELRALVPNITKMNTVAILGDAIDYIQGLDGTAKNLRDELQELTKEDRDWKNPSELRISEVTTGKTTDHEPGSSFGAKRKLPESLPPIEVYQLGSRDFLLKILHEQKHGAFSKLIEELDLMGLQVIDVSVTSCNGIVLNMLKLQANRNGIQAKNVRDTLLEFLSPRHFGSTLD